MADKANVGYAGTAAAAEAEDLVRFWWRSVVVLLPVRFVSEGDPAGVLKGGNSMVEGKTPGVKILLLRWTTDYGRCDWHKGIFFKQRPVAYSIPLLEKKIYLREIIIYCISNELYDKVNWL